jgi:hypothetical protein
LGLGCQKPPADAPETGKPSGRPNKADTASTQPSAPILTEEPTAKNPFVAKAALRPGEGTAGDTVELVIEGKTAPGWHIYAAGEAVGGATATSLELKAPPGVEPAGVWQYPQAQPGQEGQARIYAGRLLFRRLLKITDAAQRGPIEVQCALTYQACDPFRCLPPETLTLSAKGELRSR